MITGLDHVAVAVRDLDAAAERWSAMLGLTPEPEDGGGARRAWFRFADMALELITPDGEGPAGDRVRARLDAQGEGIAALAFAGRDLDALASLLDRRGLGVQRLGPAIACDPARTGGISIYVTPETPARPSATTEAPVSGLDHVVIRAADVERAVALYGARLGLDLRLDRENPQWGARQLFFRVGASVLEMAAPVKAPPEPGPDRFGGLAWRVLDPDAARARIAAAGFDVSEVRPGRKPGTRVFTVRDAPSGVPTILIQQNAEAN
jgi:catechol 2,3-dioxygenase-like lactoylglutathione lyase family enzyme